MDFTTVVVYLKDLLATIMTLLMMLSPAFGSTAEPFSAERPDELITSIAVVSDIHVETNNPEAYENLKGVLEGIKAGENIKTVVYTGDNVMNGQILESVFFYTAVRGVNPAENNIVLPGNHDYGNGAGDSVRLRKNFLANNALYLGNYLSNDYFYRVIDGVYMICLVSERPDTEDFTMTRAQLEWLEGVLKEANEADAPIIVFNHYPLRYLDIEADNADFAQVDKKELGDLLVKYGTDLFIHGHIHDYIDSNNFYESYGVKCINLCRATEITEYEAGDGIVVEVYDGEIVVRARNFIKGEWKEGLRYTYAY